MMTHQQMRGVVSYAVRSAREHTLSVTLDRLWRLPEGLRMLCLTVLEDCVGRKFTEADCWFAARNILDAALAEAALR